MIKFVQLFKNDDFYKRLRVNCLKINPELEINNTAAELYFSGASTVRQDIAYLIDLELLDSHFEELHQLSTSNFMVFVYNSESEFIGNKKVENLADHYLPVNFTSGQISAAISLGKKMLMGHAETIFPRKLINTSVSEIELLLNSVNQRIFWKNRDGMYIGCNGSFAKDFGLTGVADIIGKKDEDLLDTQSALDFSAFDAEVISKGETFQNFEKEVTFRNGDKRWLKISKYPHKKEGVIIGVIGKYEMQKKGKAKDDLFSGQNLLKILLKNTPDIVYFKDLDSRFVKISNTFCDFFGVESSDEVLGKTDFDFLPHDFARQSFANEQKIIFEGEPIENIESLEKNGNTFYLNSMKIPIKDYKGNTVGTAGITRDVTKLEIAKQQAEQISRTKSEFLSNISHELRTPLNGIIGMADVMQSTSLDKEQSEILEVIISSGNSLLDIINDVLDLSKIEAGKIEMDKEQVDIRKLIKNLAQMLGHSARENSNTIRIAIDREVPEKIFIDESKLKQVLINLIGNAIKFTKDGFIDIDINYLNKDKEQFALCFSVADTGIGIEPEQIDRIFKAYEQARASTSKKYGGTGLGLSISNRLVEIMGGELGVESEKGKGAKFDFKLNFMKNPVPEEGAE